MEENSELIRLEQFVDKLLNRYNELKQGYKSLKATLTDKENECADLRQQITELDSERTVVGAKVAGLIGRIKEWEIEDYGSGINEEHERHEP